jgi:cytochrome P450 family 110
MTGMDARELKGPRGRLLTTYRFLTDPYETSIAWRDAYGDPFLARVVNGDIVMTGRSEHLKAIFAAPPDTFDPFGVQAIAPVVGAGSLLVLTGEAHKRERKLLMPPFHGSRMRAYADTMREVTLRHLREAVRAGGVTTMKDIAQKITLEIIVRAVFGVTDQAQADDIAKGVVDVLEAVHPSFLFAPFLQHELGGFGPYARFRRAAEAGDRQLQGLIDARRGRTDGEDILGLLLAARYDDGTAMSDAEIRDELRTIVTAGHETTAMALAFLVDLVWRRPEVLARAREEADAGSAALPYLDAIVKETLRVRPILTEAVRTLKKPLQMGELEVPAGMHLGVSAVLAHADEERFPEPHLFRPERFLERTFGPTEYIPFGGGHRRCIGAAFAEMELRIVLTAFLQSVDLTLLSPSPSRPFRRNLTMAPRDGVPVRFAERRTQSLLRAPEVAPAPRQGTFHGSAA